MAESVTVVLKTDNLLITRALMFDSLLLSGTSEVALDDKGRIAIPARYRKLLTEDSDGKCQICRSLTDPCLWIYPASQWEEVSASLRSLPSVSSPLYRSIVRVVLGSAVEATLDSQGRVLLTPQLRACAGLSECKRAVLIGMDNKFELWSESAHEAQLKQDDELLRQSLPNLGDLPSLQGLKL